MANRKDETEIETRFLTRLAPWAVAGSSGMHLAVVLHGLLVVALALAPITTLKLKTALSCPVRRSKEKIRRTAGRFSRALVLRQHVALELTPSVSRSNLCALSLALPQNATAARLSLHVYLGCFCCFDLTRSATHLRAILLQFLQPQDAGYNPSSPMSTAWRTAHTIWH